MTYIKKTAAPKCAPRPFLLILLFAAACASSGGCGKKSPRNKSHPDRFYRVERGDFQIGFSQSGSVNAKAKHKLALEAAFNTKLLWVIEENEKVKEGQILAKFETDELEVKIDDLDLNLENSKRELEIELEKKRIKEASNTAEIRAAKDNLNMAMENYEKYRKLEGPKAMDQYDLTRSETERKYEEARKKYVSFQNEMLNTVYINQDEEEEAKQQLLNYKQNMLTAENNYENAVLDRKLFKRYTYPNKLTDLKNKIAQAALDLEKTKVKASSELSQIKTNILRLEMRIRRTEKDLQTHKGYMEQMKLVAPVDGVVLYGDPDRRWSRTDIEVGMDVRRQQVLLTIPDMSELIVEFDLSEKYRSRAKLGFPVIVQPESIANLSLKGRISSIASIPVNQIHWDHSSPKIYKSEVRFAKFPEKLVSGMTVKVEVITETLEGVLFVPVEAVFEDEGMFYVYMKTPSGYKKNQVEIGRASDKYVHIKSGLSEGDIIYLYRPFQGKTGG